MDEKLFKNIHICVKKRITLHFHWMEAEGWDKWELMITLSEVETEYFRVYYWLEILVKAQGNIISFHENHVSLSAP